MAWVCRTKRKWKKKSSARQRSTAVTEDNNDDVNSDDVSVSVLLYYWRRGRRDRGQLPPSAPHILACPKKFFQKYKIWGWPHFWVGEFRGKIEILSTHNLLCRKFAAVCQKITTSDPPTFLTHNATVPNRKTFLYFYHPRQIVKHVFIFIILVIIEGFNAA